jgi:hypothetical protein
MIRLDQHGDGWGGSAYAFELWRHGDGTYDGVSNVPFIGRYTTRVDSSTFALLAARLIKEELFSFVPTDSLDRHSAAVVIGCNDANAVGVTVILAGRRRYTVLDTCGGNELARIAYIIDSTAGRLQWHASE